MCVVKVSYLGTKYLTKPKWMAIGFTTVSVACVTMAMPQFISGVYHVNSEGDLNTCDGNRTQLYCDVISQTQDESAVYPGKWEGVNCKRFANGFWQWFGYEDGMVLKYV